MAAPKGNQFWRIRAKHGRDKIFSTPAQLWDAACEYFDWCDTNPLIEVDYRGSNPPVKVKIPKMRPYTIEGLVLFLGVNRTYINDFEDGIKANPQKDSKDFSEVLTRIRDIIYRQKFEGAASGFLNPQVIMRDLGLREKINTQIEGDVTISFTSD